MSSLHVKGEKVSRKVRLTELARFSATQKAHP